MPIRVYFDEPVADKAAVESHLQVTSSTPTDGVWNWMSDSEVHFRPSDYWPANTDVTLDANLYGVDFGDGVWGEKDRTVSFTIGDQHVSVADAGAHTLQVYDGDQLVQTFPMSAGSSENPTRNGAHVVTEALPAHHHGLQHLRSGGRRPRRVPHRRRVRRAHLQQRRVRARGARGRWARRATRNVSHGCINLSTDRAAWFFDFSQPGDVVEVKNSIGPTLSAADGDIYDWAIPWDQWQAGSALK